MNIQTILEFGLVAIGVLVWTFILAIALLWAFGDEDD